MLPSCALVTNHYILSGIRNYHAAMTQANRILIIDDDVRLRELLLRYLDEQGFSARAVADGSAMDKALGLNHYHLLVLDLMLTG